MTRVTSSEMKADLCKFHLMFGIAYNNIICHFLALAISHVWSIIILGKILILLRVKVLNPTSLFLFNVLELDLLLKILFFTLTFQSCHLNGGWGFDTAARHHLLEFWTVLGYILLFRAWSIILFVKTTKIFNKIKVLISIRQKLDVAFKFLRIQLFVWIEVIIWIFILRFFRLPENICAWNIYNLISGYCRRSIFNMIFLTLIGVFRRWPTFIII